MTKHIKTGAIVAVAIFGTNFLFNKTTLDETVGGKIPGLDALQGAVAVRLAATAAVVVTALVMLKAKV